LTLEQPLSLQMGEGGIKKQRPKPLFFLGDRMAAALALVVVMMIVGVRTVVIVVVMAVPVIVPMAVTLVLRIVTVLIPPSGHKHLEVLRTVGMVMVLAEGPVIQQRVSGE
jgi:hypothetical protein